MQCPTCQDEMRQVPAGVSKKTGKPYRAFFACDKQACKEAKKSNYNTTAPAPVAYQTQACNCEETIAKIRIAFGDMQKRVQGLETLVESLSSKKALEFHQGVDPKVEIAAQILGGDVEIPTINHIPWEK